MTDPEPELLDLGVHGPLGRPGTLVRLRGAEYLVGPQVGQGAGGMVHTPTNRRSGLSLLALKLYRDQARAEHYLRTQTGSLALLYQAGPDADSTYVWGIAAELPGGLAELMPNLLACEPPDSPTGQLTDRANELIRELPLVAFDPEAELSAAELARVREAMELCEQALELNPAHTVALHTLALIAAEQHDWNEAGALSERGIALEPNELRPRRNAVRFLAMTDRRWTAADSYCDLKSIFPFESQLDLLGIQLLLACGRLAEAEELLDHPFLHPDARETGGTAVAAAASVRDSMSEVIKTARDAVGGGDPQQAITALEAALAAGVQDPLLVANLGLAMAQAGRPADAAKHLLSVVLTIPLPLRTAVILNAAVAQSRAGETAHAGWLLGSAFRFLAPDESGEEFEIDLSSLPGTCVWIDNENRLQRPAAELSAELEALVERAGGPAMLDPDALSLVEIYRSVRLRDRR
jgi:tetratricopeptide (TPR) repeat protein